MKLLIQSSLSLYSAFRVEIFGSSSLSSKKPQHSAVVFSFHQA